MRKVVGIFAALFFFTALAPPTAHANLPDDFTLAAHRGSHPPGVTENTLRALALADSYGASTMETDLRLTSDRYLVIMHDPTLRRTTTCRGYVAARTKADIKNHCRAKDGQRIPFATDILTSAQDRGLNLMLELKADRVSWTDAKLRDLRDLIAAKGMGRRVMIISFDVALLNRVRAISAMPTLWILNDDPASHATVSTTAVSAFPRYLTTQSAADLRRRNVAVFGRESENPDAWATYRQAGVDGINTDDVPAWIEWRRTQQN